MRLASFALVLLAAFAPALSAQDAEAPCEIRGHLTIPDVRVFDAGGVVSLATITDRDVRITPIRRGLYQVRTDDAGEAIEGRAEQPLALALASERTFGNVVTVAVGTRVDELEPARSGLRARISVHEGVALHRLPLRCEDLVASAPTEAGLDTASALRGPRWRVRVSRLAVRGSPADEISPVTLALEPEAHVTWIERERREGWVRVQTALSRARVDGWVRDSDLRSP